MVLIAITVHAACGASCHRCAAYGASCHSYAAYEASCHICAACGASCYRCMWCIITFLLPHTFSIIQRCSRRGGGGGANKVFHLERERDG